ncbi:MAG: hypothetical protein C0483_06430 [Pirellula sp.]|nr:hypothetical protein [Pirellula sp.]
MTALRLLFVTRRFRPLTGGLENLSIRLLGEWVRRGHKATVVTPRWHADWPDETDYAGVRVCRIDPPTNGCWGEARYARRLSATCRALRSQTDVVLVSGMLNDAVTLLGEKRRGGAVVALQPERPGAEGDCHLQIERRGGRRVKQTCFGADAFLALTPLLQRELTAAGYARSRIRSITLGIPRRSATDLGQRHEARRNLASVDPALALAATQSLVVYVGRLRLGKGLDTLLAAWRRIVESGRRDMLWLVGEGPDAGYLREKAIELGLASSVRLTGAFDDVEDALRAADIAVCPALEDGIGLGILEAASFGLPIIAADTTTARDLVTTDQEAILFEKHDDAALAQALLRILDDAPLARRLGTAARERVQRTRSLSTMADEYESILGSIARPVAQEATS